nr:PREDICTED: E3 ubiquitin-protein ligase RNF4-like [Linepithema humile]XP_012215001.1 PREDICTED: E3 ubiquitin-protein ligase RNF4-like [Linepithema humile]XP_012215002.1 PREDICTED: E3 ubiquitin-protein ligase RNF4-like [Linepithema humile]
MASEEDVLCVDSSYDTIDIIDLTKESPKIRPLRSRLRHRYSPMIRNSRSLANRNSRFNQRSLSPLTLGNTQDTEIENSTRKKRTCRNLPSTHNTTVNLDDTNEEKINEEKNDICYVNTHHKEDNEGTSLSCPICLEFLCSDLKPTTTRCGHIFCAKCLKTHMHVENSNKKKCPTCQSKITLKSCTRLYI